MFTTVNAVERCLVSILNGILNLFRFRIVRVIPGFIERFPMPGTNGEVILVHFR
ncbi:MAG: hypothetical protein UX68_C0008G0025 [Parcubacteria group bacterium GW2011_GWA2_46_9]|nr:MAG: hypothetical protein UX68_C0008G0025 [Parcubacteria group bacterium GW2011_GWA2_46_9]